jgi:glycosyltransferase involved in cell wall biosynthesis
MPRKILMLCYYFPPIRAVGATRSVAFSSLLQGLGWEVTVLSVENPKDKYVPVADDPTPEGVKVSRAGELNLGAVTDFLHPVLLRVCRLFGVELKRNYFRELFCVPDAQITWLCLPRLRRLATENEVLYVSCSPFSAAVFGCLVKRMTGVSLVLDFRDAWTLNPHVSYSKPHRWMIERLERWCVKVADRVILNSDGAKRLYESFYREFRAKFLSIPNGFDSLDLAPAKSSGDTIKIMHIGSFYGSRSPENLFSVLAELVRENSGFSFEFVQVGGSLPYEEEFKDKVRIRRIAKVSRVEALELMQSAEILYLRQGFEEGVSNYIAVAAKTYEYISTGLPILAEVPPGDNAEVVFRYGSGAEVVTTNSREDLKAALLRLAEGKRWERPEIREDYIEAFSREKLARRLSELCNDLRKARLETRR